MAKESNGGVKVGVIGYGGAFNMGRKHLQEMQAAGMVPTAVCEIDPTRLTEAEKDFPGIQQYGDVGEMLKKSDVELVTIITPHNLHAPQAIQCLKAGRHVVTEKPFAITTKECDDMISAARKTGRTLSTYHNRHWDGCILEAVKQIKQKKVIGEVFRIECHMGGYSMPRNWWRSSKSVSGGILYDWGVHLLEYSLQLMDGNLTEVTGVAKTGHWAELAKKNEGWKADPNEDEAYALARFDNGKWITLSITHLDSKSKEGLLEVTGTNGTYVFDIGEWTIHQHKDGVRTTRRGKNPESKGQSFYDNVAAHLKSGEPLVITPEWARRPIHIIDLAVQSAAA
ncbi:MAG: Gfo/Idh/MocA family protein, partial [Phycisphaerae bacterium]